jgi:hypothetical protein
LVSERAFPAEAFVQVTEELQIYKSKRRKNERSPTGVNIPFHLPSPVIAMTDFYYLKIVPF